jgi:hypothetical protein
MGLLRQIQRLFLQNPLLVVNGLALLYLEVGRNVCSIKKLCLWMKNLQSLSSKKKKKKPVIKKEQAAY